MENIMRWEYTVVNFTKRFFFSGRVNAEQLEKTLNEWGREGWEVVSSTQNNMQTMVIILKRPAKR
ncbi:MAG TPA: DUF4177 domain-containing protein [Cellvibrio sp.]|nr:DUF4177 domain-containing protein [Cellvibrio sp.]